MPKHSSRRDRAPSYILRLCAIAAAVACSSLTSQAQQAPARDTVRTGATRAELESLASQLDQDAERSTDAKTRTLKQQQAAAVRERLQDGDFRIGDRIAIIVRGDPTLNDTVAVRAGQTIQLKALPAISLHGILHSELQSYLTKQLGQYLKNPAVEVMPLLQVAVVGDVVHPGFYWAPSDLTLTDAIMLAGGPTQDADVNQTKILRDNKDRVSTDDVRRAFAAGTTLDQLDVRAGDQIEVGAKGKTDWVKILQVAAIAASLTVSIFVIARH